MQVQVEALPENASPPEEVVTAAAAGDNTAAAGGGTGVTGPPSSSPAASSSSSSGGSLNRPLTAAEMMPPHSPTRSSRNNLPRGPWQRSPAAAAALAETDTILAEESGRPRRVVQENNSELTMMYGSGVAAAAGVRAGSSDSAVPARTDRSVHKPSHPPATKALVPDPENRSAGGTGVTSGVVWQGTLPGQQATGPVAGVSAGGSTPGLEVLGGEGQRLQDMRFAGTDLSEVAAVLLSEEEDLP